MQPIEAGTPLDASHGSMLQVGAGLQMRVVVVIVFDAGRCIYHHVHVVLTCAKAAYCSL